MSGLSWSIAPPTRAPAPLFACAGVSFIIAGAGVAAWNAIGHVPHGWWLASFLALVGGVAQLLLGDGHRRCTRRALGGPVRPAVIWNIGTLLVPLGVLAQARIAVVVGSVALLAALGRLSLTLRGPSRPATREMTRVRAAYVALLVFLAVSVLVGTGLAWDRPWV